MTQIIFNKKAWINATTREPVTPKDGDEIVIVKSAYGWLQELMAKDFTFTMGERVTIHEPKHKHDTATQ